MLIKDSIDKDIFSPYKEDEEDLDFLMWELEELNKQIPKNGSNSWDL